MGSIPGLGRSPGEGNVNPLQFSCLGNAMDRGTRRATVYRVAKSQTQLSDYQQQKYTETGGQMRRPQVNAGGQANHPPIRTP